jgi:chemotaxis protein MotA
MVKRVLDHGTLSGVILAVSSIAVGLWLEGGDISQILQPTAALIVLAGTTGAVLMQYPLATVRETAVQLREVFFHAPPPRLEFAEEIVALCMQVRRNGWMSLDAQLDRIDDPFLRKAITLAVDGVQHDALRVAMEIDLDLRDERDESVVSVLHAAGGFAPTLGLIGAVLGLIQVMQKMENLGEIGKGIAVAFVSTLYGIAAANLLFLPWAGKLKIRARERQQMREMTLEAVLLMVDGITPSALRERLDAYAQPARVRTPAQPAVELRSL